MINFIVHGFAFLHLFKQYAMNSFQLTIGRFIMGLKRPSRSTNRRRLREWGETLESFTIREVTDQDLLPLVDLHVQTWADTYWTVKQPPTHETRERQWREVFKQQDGSWCCFVVQNRAGKLIGFAHGVHYSHPDMPGFEGELSKIYLLLEYQRLGLGRLLIGHIARKFLGQGIRSMLCFGVPQNPSNRFYETLHGERLYDKKGDFHGGYGWKDLEKLAAICPID
ncbi:GNAT family N-acetyltransferase [Paraflavitalea pollutisoli]|uniref:GNAT family N-acetyltransferase n=1 Tax=Paraflavitalea pollutisoli TaxID=3034143 RepID=UPI0023EE12A9|nr:GNAT family N-acetyltransferase [Paraflavitalea sp. H1-2-19X]